MDDNKFAYFEGFRDGLLDAADFLRHLAENCPPEVKHLTAEFKTILDTMRSKAEASYEFAKSIGQTQQ